MKQKIIETGSVPAGSALQPVIWRYALYYPAGSAALRKQGTERANAINGLNCAGKQPARVGRP